MQRKDICLIALLLTLSSCVKVEFSDTEPEEAEEQPAEYGDSDQYFEDMPPTDFDSIAGDSFMPPNLERVSTSGRGPSHSAAAEGDEFERANWETNPSRALSKAKVLKRPLVVLFTGLGWNNNADLLNREVLQTKTFNEFANQHLILSFLDYPENITRAPDSMRAMKKKYGVHGYPTLLLLDANGKIVYRESGYRPGRARDYFNALRLATLEYRGQDVTVEAEPANN